MSDSPSYGIVEHPESSRPTDYLYRISIKGLIRSQKGEVLVVKETGRDWWDLPGGGMDHGESIKEAIARELREEVSLVGDFTYKIIMVEEPAYLEAHNFWQVRMVFEIIPENYRFSAGADSDEIAFMRPEVFKTSSSRTEQRIYEYAVLAGEVAV